MRGSQNPGADMKTPGNRCTHPGAWVAFVCPRRSWGRRWQDFLILRRVFEIVVTRGHDRQVVVHLVTSKDLAELRDEQSLRHVAGELLQVLDVVGGRFTHQVAEGTLLLGLRQTRANDLRDRLGPFLVLTVGEREAFIRIGYLLAVGGLAGEDADVVLRQLAGPLHRRRRMAVLVRRRTLAGDEAEVELLGPLHERRNLLRERLQPFLAFAG